MRRGGFEQWLGLGPPPPPTPSAASTFPATAGEVIEGGSLVYISGTSIVSKTDESVAAKVRAVGVTLAPAIFGGLVVVQVDDIVTTRMEDGLVLSPNDAIFLGTDGRGTNIPPPPASVQVFIGLIFNASGYTGVASSAVVLLQIETPYIVP